MKKDFRQIYRKLFSRPEIVAYKDIVKSASYTKELNPDEYPCVIPNWDNTSRRGTEGLVFKDSTPELFRIHLNDAIQSVARREPEHRVVFIKSWNEWAEGNYLEPDRKFGRAYLEVIKDECLFK